MSFAAVRAILALRLKVQVVIPGVLLWWTGSWRLSRPDEPTLWLGLGLLALGLTLVTITIRQFDR